MGGGVHDFAKMEGYGKVTARSEYFLYTEFSNYFGPAAAQN